jgi:DNA-binding transcriptional regulator LsrR (DeoR family)
MTPERIDVNDYDRARLIHAALTLYYGQELTQADVARRLGLSTTKVNRLLQQARRQGMVEVIIHMPFQHLFDLETRLKAIFDLSDVMVIPRIVEEATAVGHNLGRVGANCLLQHLRDGDVVGIGGGTAVHAVVQALKPNRPYKVEVVPVLGAVQGQVTTDVNYLAAHLAERLGGKAYQLHAPAFVDTREHRDVLLSMGPVKEILDIARRTTVALLGVGAVDSEASRFVQFTALSAAEMKHIAEDCGGVGEIAAYVYDIRGHPCAEEFANRVVGLSLQELGRIPFTIGVAATAVKAAPLYGALRGGYLDAIVTDEAAAQGIVEFFEQDFREESYVSVKKRGE